MVAALAKTGAARSATITGSTDGLRGLPLRFEAALHPLARTTFRCLKNMGNDEDAAKVDLTPTNLRDALPSQFAIVEEKFSELDDLIIQFRGTEAGERFVDAWFNARRVVDTGRRVAKPNPAVVVNTISSTPQAKAA